MVVIALILLTKRYPPPANQLKPPHPPNQQGVNTTYFDPALHKPLPNLEGRYQLVFGRRWSDKQRHPQRLRASTGGSSSSGSSSSSSSSSSSTGSGTSADEPQRRPFRFISSFKWEARKGWDLLLEAYLTEFSGDDDVELYILTKPWDKSGSEVRASLGGAGRRWGVVGRGGGCLARSAWPTDGGLLPADDAPLRS